MTLDNLIGISLERAEADNTSIIRLLNAAERNIADAHIDAVSNENRFDAAYKAIMQLANAALLAKGYRTPVNQGITRPCCSCWVRLSVLTGIQ